MKCFTRVRIALGLSLSAMLAAPHTALAWGLVGHRYANRLAVADLPPDLQPLYAANRDWIVQHSSDPDNWRNTDRAEGPNHFIDMDTFGPDVAEHYPQDYWLACGLYGKAEVDKNGLVPWRIGQYYGKLVRAFKSKDVRAIIEMSTWLGHYVADVHVPFHAVANYDGQLTGQKGIHARFESIMVEKQITFEDLKTHSAHHVASPVKSAFEWARDSLHATKSVLDADKEAAAQDSAYGDSYYTLFGSKTRFIAVQRLEASGQDLASLWVSAWQEAGKPDLPQTADVHAGEALDAPTHDPDRAPRPVQNSATP